jgi:NADH:ubiquinone oxidoreductase subunit F (NADH-binding)/(2Fe-2S) ferredoxin
MQIRCKEDLDKLTQRGIKRLNPNKVRIQVGTATCGLAKGAKETVEALKQAVKDIHLKAAVVNVGCNGQCYAEPIVEVIASRMPKLTYGMVTPDSAEELIRSVKTREVTKETGLLYQTCAEKMITGLQLRYGKKIEGFSDQSDLEEQRAQTRIVMRNAGIIDPLSLEEYAATGGFAGLAKALSVQYPQNRVIKEVEKSNLRGRGGAAFPTGMKWHKAKEAKGDKKYVVANASEGDPDVGMHRSLLESDPLSVVEGMMICGIAIGADQGYIYLNSNYNLAEEHLVIVLEKLRKVGLLGNKILGSEFSFAIDVKRGSGAYVSGEETALLNALEGEVAEPRERPPFPVEHGLFSMPTVVNNVETLMNIPVILHKGGNWYAKHGVPGSRGTKVLSVTGDVTHSMVVEIPLGIKIKEIIRMVGGVRKGKKLKAFQVGGPSGGILPARKSILPLDFQSLSRENHLIGSGLIVMDEDTDVVGMARFFSQFFEEESCGKCVPCREGTHKVRKVLDEIIAGKGSEDDLDYLQGLEGPIGDSSACGLGKTFLAPVVSTIKYFRNDYNQLIVKQSK